MKVTVCFGDVRILVPCGSGELLVRDLISEATRRYKKAAGKRILNSFEPEKSSSNVRGTKLRAQPYIPLKTTGTTL
ncbi:hypothetical protein ACLKA6_018613 [Drosophila palustris]